MRRWLINSRSKYKTKQREILLDYFKSVPGVHITASDVCDYFKEHGFLIELKYAPRLDYIKILEDHQGLKVCCPEEIAYKNGWISKEQLIESGKLMEKNQYAKEK